MNDGPATGPLTNPAAAAPNIVRRIATICNQRGLHARASARFVKMAAEFDADVRVRKNGTEVSGRSIMGLMMLAAGKGSKVKFLATGEDAPQMLAELEQLFSRKFDEA